MENSFEKNEDKQEMLTPSLQEIEIETPRSKPALEIDGNIPESVKEEVNRKIWDRLQKEDFPPERAD